MPEREAAQNSCRGRHKSLGEELEKLQVEYNNKLQNYIEAQDTLSNVVRQLRERELRELQGRIQEFQSQARRISSKGRVNSFSPYLKRSRRLFPR
jgi:outer membrane protein